MYTIDHIGIAVRSIDEARVKYERDFGLRPEHRETVESQKTEILFLVGGGTKIELLAPSAADGPIAKHLEKRGEGLHHLCYEVADIRAELARLEAAGHRLIDTVPRPGAHGTLIAFLHPKSLDGVLTELCQKIK